jgi:hypothetical protein
LTYGNASNNTTGGNIANNTNATASSAMSASTIETTTYGPDLNSPITGTYHIEGPKYSAILLEHTINNVLLTDGSGFIGAHFIRKMVSNETKL